MYTTYVLIVTVLVLNNPRKTPIPLLGILREFDSLVFNILQAILGLEFF